MTDTTITVDDLLSQYLNGTWSENNNAAVDELTGKERIQFFDAVTSDYIELIERGENITTPASDSWQDECLQAAYELIELEAD